VREGERERERERGERQFNSLSVCDSTRGVYDCWGCGKTYEELFTSIKNFIATNKVLNTLHKDILFNESNHNIDIIYSYC
jgi:hypothetical protein